MAQTPDKYTLPQLDDGGLNYPKWYPAIVIFAARLASKAFPDNGLAHLVLNPKDLPKWYSGGIPTILTPCAGGGQGHYDDQPPTGFNATTDGALWKHNNDKYTDFKHGENTLKAAIIAAIGPNNEAVIFGTNPLEVLSMDIRTIMDKLEATFNIASVERLANLEQRIAQTWHASNGHSVRYHMASIVGAFQEKADMMKIPVDSHAVYNAMRASLVNDANFQKSLADHYDHDNELTARNIDNLSEYMLRHFPALVTRAPAYAAAAVDTTGAAGTTGADQALQAVVNAAVAQAMQASGLKHAAGRGAYAYPQQAVAPVPKAILAAGVLYCSKHGYSLVKAGGHAGIDCKFLDKTNASASQKNATTHVVKKDGTVVGSWKGFELC